MNRFLLTTFMATSSILAFGAEEEFSYNPDNLPDRGFGYDKEESYDVAIYIDNASLNGAKVKGIEVPIPGGNDISGCSGWLTKELKLKKKNGKNVNNPDITSIDGVMNNGTLRVMFETPYEITGAFYAGYSFNVNNLTETTSAPVMVADVVNPNGLYIHSSRSKLKWMNCAEDAAGISVMKVILEGDFNENSASFLYTPGIFVSAEDDGVVNIKIANNGLNPVESIGYEYFCSGKKGVGTTVFNAPLQNFGSTGTVAVNLGQLTDIGLMDVTFTVSEVNGSSNKDISPSIVLPVKVYPFIPVNRPLVEEYTGLWCGWCVRGYVALETMKERYPEQFIGLAYHNGDPMEINFEHPTYVSSYPSAFVNRSKSNINIADIYTIWPEIIKELTHASIDVKIEWTDENKSALKAISTTRFIDSYEKADFAICYALIEDGMSDPTWAQHNSYAPEDGEEPKDSPEMPGELGQIFTHGAEYVFGLIFNDVVIALPQPFGYPGSVPAVIEAGEPYIHSCIINVDDIVNNGGNKIVRDKSKLRVVATIIDRKTGLAVNCNSSGYADTSMVNTIVNDSDIVSTVYYDMQGRRIREPGKGIFIRLDIHSDGTVRSQKISI